MAERRKDSKNRVLKDGESERKNGTYQYRWCVNGKRKSVYAKTLKELRTKEEQIFKDLEDGTPEDAASITLNDIYDRWIRTKNRIRGNTRSGYERTYNSYVRDSLGKQSIQKIKASDMKIFYQTVADEKQIKKGTLYNIQKVLHQAFDFAVDDNYIRKNPSIGAIKDVNIAKGGKRETLTVDEQNTFLDFVKSSPQYQRLYPLFVVMIGTGMRVGELTGLRWEDIDLEKRIINVNHVLVYYQHEDGKSRFAINPTKTESSTRTIPMISAVHDAFIREQTYQQFFGIHCTAEIDGYSNFIFCNSVGNPQTQACLDRSLRRIIRDCNKHEEKIPYFTCHTLRHTFATRLCESGMNIKVIQDTLGHADIQTTMNIYVDATEDLKRSEYAKIKDFLSD